MRTGDKTEVIKVRVSRAQLKQWRSIARMAKRKLPDLIRIVMDEEAEALK